MSFLLSFWEGLFLHDCICVEKQDQYVPKAAQLLFFFVMHAICGLYALKMHVVANA